MKDVPASVVADVLQDLNADKTLKRVTRFVSEKQIVRMTRRYPMQSRDDRTEVVLTIGRPNERERALIARSKRDRMGLPESKFAFFPKKKAKRAA